MSDSDINFATIKINCRSPKNGFQVNVECKELLYIINGSGNLYKQDNEEVIEFEQGDVLFIDKNEYYAFDGNFEAAYLVPRPGIQSNINILRRNNYER